MQRNHAEPQSAVLDQASSIHQFASSRQAPAGVSPTMIDELRHPLASISRLAELLNATELTGRQSEYAESITAAAAHLDRLLNELGQTPDAMCPNESTAEPCNGEFGSAGCTVRTVLNQAVAALAPRAHQRQIEIVADVAGNDDPVLVDLNGLSNVLLNLLSNALDHSQGRRVRLLAVQVRRLHGPDTYRFAVSDDGGSLNPLQVAQLFDTSTNACRGLLACQDWVSRHGGQIEVAVDPGTSTTFWFDIPVGGMCDETAA